MLFGRLKRERYSSFDAFPLSVQGRNRSGAAIKRALHIDWVRDRRNTSYYCGLGGVASSLS